MLAIYLAFLSALQDQPRSSGPRVLSLPPAPAEQVFQFETLLIVPPYNMAVYGPFRSAVKDCSSQDAICVSTSFLTLAAPRQCRSVTRGVSLGAGETKVTMIGEVRQVVRGKRTRLSLWTPATRPESVYAYSPDGGIAFVMIDVIRQGFVGALRDARSMRARERILEANEGAMLKATSASPMLACR